MKQYKLRERKNYPLFIIIVLLIIYIGGYFIFCNVTMPKTYVNGINVSNCDYESIKQKLIDYYSGRVEILSYDGNEIISIRDFGPNCDYDEKANEILIKQERFKWPWKIITGSNIELSFVSNFNEDELRERCKRLQAYNVPNRTCQDANIRLIAGETPYYTIDEEVYGKDWDLTDLMNKVSKDISYSKNVIDLRSLYTEPSKKMGDEALMDILDRMNNSLDTKITYTYGFSKYIVDKTEVIKLIDSSLGENYVSLDTVFGYLVDLNDKIASYEIALQGTNGHIYNYTYDSGYLIDADNEAERLMNYILDGVEIETEFYLIRTPQGKNNYDYNLDYVEVDLGNQKVYLFCNGDLTLDSRCVSGCVASNHETPTGAFKISYTARNVTLRGEMMGDGSYEYESFVNYWMPFNKGIGLHDADWRSKFGGTIYKRSGSHGCVNLPYESAKTIFEHVDEGYWVFVHD